MAAAIQQRFKQVFGIGITEGCGMTELQIYCMNPPYGEKKIGSIGKPIAGMELSLIDDSGPSISTPRPIGGIIVRGGSMTSCYSPVAELTQKTMNDGRVH